MHHKPFTGISTRSQLLFASPHFIFHSSLRSIAAALQDGQPVAIFDVSDDPRIQYTEAALKEGVASILSVPIIIGEKFVRMHAGLHH